jgi:hypothetical protein
MITYVQITKEARILLQFTDTQDEIAQNRESSYQTIRYLNNRKDVVSKKKHGKQEEICSCF